MMLQRLTMWGLVTLVLAWGSVGALAESRLMGRLFWCKTMCMCETETNTEVKCFDEGDVHQLLNHTSKVINRLKKANFSLESRLYWCEDMCLCHNATGKRFGCTQPLTLTQLILDKIGNTYFLEPERNNDIKQEAERSVDQKKEEGEEEEEAALEQEEGHRRRSERKKNKKNRNQKKNKKMKNRHHSEEPEPEPVPESESQPEPEPEPVSEPQPQPKPASEPESEPVPEPEPQPEPKVDVYTPSNTQTPTPVMDTPSVHVAHFGYEQGEVEEIEATEEPEPLPKQEAVAASPAVTALQPPTRQLQPFGTAESFTPRASARELEPLAPRIQPVVEVPKEKKTVASMVSQDLDDLDSTVRDIRNDVMLNQRILLVTVAVAGVAMLGVLILAILGCTNRRQNQARDAAKKRDGPKDGNRSPKVNLEEAW